jgi:hypothetical protein
VRRVAGRNEDHAIKRKRFTRLAGNRQMAIVNGIEGSTQQADAR